MSITDRLKKALESAIELPPSEKIKIIETPLSSKDLDIINRNIIAEGARSNSNLQALLSKSEGIELPFDKRWKWFQILIGSPLNSTTGLPDTTGMVSLAAGATTFLFKSNTYFKKDDIFGYLFNNFLQLTDQNTVYSTSLDRGGNFNLTLTFNLLQQQGYGRGTRIKVLTYDEINGIFTGEYFPGANNGMGTPFRGTITFQLTNPNAFAIKYFFELELLILNLEGWP